MNEKGRFITFEGIDGAGKSTHIERLAAEIKRSGIEVVVTREPGGTPLGEKIRSMLLSDPMTPDTETLLFYAARAEHVQKLIRPALDEGKWVISDRFSDATFAYQAGGKNVPGGRIDALERWTLRGFAPDLTILFDLPPEIAAARLSKRTVSDGVGPDRFERESRDFFRRVRGAYLERAEKNPERFLVLDARKTPDELFEELFREVSRWL